MHAFELDPRLESDCYYVTDLELCRLLLMNNSLYPWCILVPMRANIKDIYELEAADQQQLIRESSRLSEVMMQLFPGEKMNVAALGNVVPQLHIHHIVRRTTDNAWPAPVWGHEPAIPYADGQASTLCAQLQSAVANLLQP